jgi:hypothetical protein
LRDLCVHYFGDPSVAAYYEHREAALAPILARCYEGAAGMPKEAADRRAALLEASLVKEFPAAWGILAQARLKATDPACRRRLQEEQAALLAVMERAQPMAQARLQQGY